MKLLITGAAGFIGQHTLYYAHKCGYKIKALIHKHTITPPFDIEVVQGDIKDKTTINKAVENCNTVIHLAAINRLWHQPYTEFYEINFKATLALLRAAAKHGVKKFIYAGSAITLGGGIKNKEIQPNAKIAFSKLHGHYAKSKFLAEEAIKNLSNLPIETVIIKPTAVIGPGEEHNTPAMQAVKLFISGKVKAYYPSGFNVVDVRDVAKSFVNAIQHGEHNKNYLVAGHNVPLEELFRLLANELGVEPPKRQVGYTIIKTAAILFELKSRITRKEPQITTCGIQTIKYPWYFKDQEALKALKITPTPLEKTIKDIAQYYKRKGFIA